MNGAEKYTANFAIYRSPLPYKFFQNIPCNSMSAYVGSTEKKG